MSGRSSEGKDGYGIRFYGDNGQAGNAGRDPRLQKDEIMNSAGHFMYEISRGGIRIYDLILFFVFVAFILSIFLKVDICVNAYGVLKPKGDRIVLTSPSSGLLEVKSMSENGHVSAGDTLFVVDYRRLVSKENDLMFRKRQIDTMLSDLGVLIGSGRRSDIASDKYRSDYSHYAARMAELSVKEEVAEKQYERNRNLYESRLISAAEFEKSEADYKNAGISRKIYYDGKIAEWENERFSCQKELVSIEEQLDQLILGISASVVLAPVSGTVMKIHSIKDGQFVQSGQIISEISPTGKLMAECYVGTKDIGLVRIGQKCRIIVDAFDYNEWGSVEGTVSEIFDDVYEKDGLAVYKIYCDLGKDFLQLKNGMRGNLKKGMAISVSLVLAKRTLFNLVFDNIHDWIDPYRS